MNSNQNKESFQISDEDVFPKLHKGEMRARTIIARAPKDQNQRQAYLKSQFDLVAKITNQLLDNFDLHKFNERENYKLPAESLKAMLLSTFESVRCLQVLETAITCSSDLRTAEGLKIALTKAASVYASNGDNDTPSLCAIRMLAQRKPIASEARLITRDCA